MIRRGRTRQARFHDPNVQVPEYGCFCILYFLLTEMSGSWVRVGSVERTLAQRDTRDMLRMLSKRTMYTTPNERLISTLTRDHNAAVRINESFSASWI